jgi:hypothetical protein
MCEYIKYIVNAQDVMFKIMLTTSVVKIPVIFVWVIFVKTSQLVIKSSKNRKI